MAARGIHKRASLEVTPHSIIEVAQGALPGFDQIGISVMDRKGNVATRAATGDLVWTLDNLQYGLREGPCVDTLHDKLIVGATRFLCIRSSERA